MCRVCRNPESEGRNRSTVLKAVGKCGRALRSASQFQDDKEIVIKAIQRKGTAIKYASKNLRKDREIVMEAVKQTGYAFRFVSKRFQNDREIVMAGVKHNGFAFRFASEKLRSDREIVMNAVQWNGFDIRSTSKELRNDRMIVIEAIKRCRIAINYISEELLYDPSFLLDIVTLDEGSILQSFPSRFRNDKMFVLDAVVQQRNILQWASEDLLSDRSFVLQTLDCRGYYIPPAFRNDTEIVLKAFRNDPWNTLQQIHPLTDPDLIRCLIDIDGTTVFRYAKEIQWDRNMLFTILAQNPYVFHGITETEYGTLMSRFPNNMRELIPEFLIEAVKTDGLALRYISNGSMTHDLVVTACSQDPRAKAFVPVL